MHNESHPDQHEINHYHLTYYFEVAVECVNSLAGLLVLIAVCLAGINLIIVAVNSVTGSDYRLIDPLHATRKATILRIRLMLGEQTALALALLVAADVLDTVMKPSHAFEMNDVIKMGFLTVLRTGVAYFLAREIKELELGGGHSNDFHSNQGYTENMMEHETVFRRRNTVPIEERSRKRRSGDNLTSVRSNSSRMKFQEKEASASMATINSTKRNHSSDFALSYEECDDDFDYDDDKCSLREEQPASLRFRGRSCSTNNERSGSSSSISNNSSARHRKNSTDEFRAGEAIQYSTIHEE